MKAILIFLLLVFWTGLSAQYTNTYDAGSNDWRYVSYNGLILKAGGVTEQARAAVTITSAYINNDYTDGIHLIFSEAMTTSPIDFSTDFTLSVDASPVTLSSSEVVISSTHIIMQRSSGDFAVGDVVTFDHTNSETENESLFASSDDEPLADYNDYSVTNNLTGSFNGTIYHTWTFDDEELGHWPDDSIHDYFVDYTNDHLHNTSQQSWFIVEDTINETRHVQRKHWYDADQATSQICPEINPVLSQGFEEVYISFDYQIGVNWSSKDGGKIPGVYSGEEPEFVPVAGDGFVYKLNFKEGGTFNTYIYDDTYGWNPTAVLQDTFQFMPGTSYRVTERIVLNSFDGDSPNSDGIFEVFVDGKPKYILTSRNSRDEQGEGYEIESFNFGTFYGPGSGSAAHDCYNYFDNIQVWVPDGDDDDTFGTHNVHNSTDSIAVPNPLTYEEFHYDYLIDDDSDDLECPGSSYPASTNTSWLIDAGAGNTVEIDFDAGTVGSGNYLIFYDGKYSSRPSLELVEGPETNLGDNWGTSGVVESTGRWMFVSLMSDDGAASGDFTGDITFN